MASRGRFAGAEGLASVAWVGTLPSDGAPVACWVVHPDHPEHSGHAHQFAAAAGLPPATVPGLEPLDAERAGIVIDDDLAHLTLWGLPVATTTCDRRWCGVAEERGWAVLTVGLDSPPPPSETEEFVAYLSRLDRLHMGVVQLVAVD
nr:hypothetical protein [uncultured Actinotalea sp.]